MGITRPNSDQVRFISESNGEQILDPYMEAAERGGRALGDLMAELFDETGSFTTFFQWREDPLTPGDLQYRLGTYVDPEAGWTTFTFTPYGSPQAKEWATTDEDVLVSVGAGGNGVDEYSAKHWALKAAESADSFDDRYLGPKASDPSFDNDGNALTEGAVYWNSVAKELRFYDALNLVWISATGSPVGEAPIDGAIYGRQSGAWVAVSGTATDFTVGGDLYVDGNLYVDTPVANDGFRSLRLISDPANSNHDWYLSMGVQYVGGIWQLARTGDSPSGVFFNGESTTISKAILAAGNHNSLTAGANIGRPDGWNAAVEVSGAVGIIRHLIAGTTHLSTDVTETTVRNGLRITTGTTGYVESPIIRPTSKIELGSQAHEITGNVAGVVDFQRGDAGTEMSLRFSVGANVQGQFFVNTTGVKVLVGPTNKTAMNAVDSGQVELYYNNSKKIETTNTGISVTGDVIATGAIDATALGGLVASQFVRADVSSLITGISGATSLSITKAGAETGSLLVLTNQASNTSPILSITQPGTGVAVDITNTGGTGIAVSNAVNRTGISVTNTGSAGTALSIDAHRAAGMTIADSNTAQTTSGDLLDISNANASRSGPLVDINQNATTPNVAALDILQSSSHANAYGLVVTMGASTTSAGVVVSTFGTGAGITSIASNAAAMGLYVYSGIANRTTPLVLIWNDNATGAGTALNVTQDQAGTALQVTCNSAGAYGINVYSNEASRTMALLRVMNDNATGSGTALRVQQDQGGYGIYVTSNNSASPSMLVDGTSTAPSLELAGAEPRIRFNSTTSPSLAEGDLYYDGTNLLFRNSSESLALDSQGLGEVLLLKSSNSDFQNNTTLTDDADLQFSVAANQRGFCRGVIFASCFTNGVDLKFKVAGSMTILAFGMHAYNSGIGGVVYGGASGATEVIDIDATQGYIMVPFHIWYNNTGGGATTLKLQYAQNVSNAALMRVFTGSYMIHKITS